MCRLLNRESRGIKLIKDKFGSLIEADSAFANLCEVIKGYEKLVVAFSGGVDSTFLIKVASELLGDNAIALTVNSPYIADWEIEEAKELTHELNINHKFLIVEKIPNQIINNPVNRCYLCKTEIFSTIKKRAKEMGIDYVADGSNVDDTKDYRPGMRALSELEIKSPLMEAGITKAQIRKWSKELGLPTWDKPPYACLLTRLPYDQPIVIQDLKMIEAAEGYLIGRGIRAVRVRKHDGIARIEAGEAELEMMMNVQLLKEIADELKSYGFEYVTLDLAGYKMGSFNKGITEERNA